MRTTPAQATASLRLAQDLCDRFPLIGAALNDGTISLPQADAIVTGLRKLPARLTRAELTRCEEEILQHVDTLGPSELRVLAARLVEIIDPDASDADDAKRLAREEAAAYRGRFLRLAPDYHGSMSGCGEGATRARSGPRPSTAAPPGSSEGSPAGSLGCPSAHSAAGPAPRGGDQRVRPRRSSSGCSCGSRPRNRR
ncbi:DUF222 domain-containing protein [Tessaracoccus lapidicaptus]|uniref:DUF222 domain-containing protein n=1 Tax=Tessaracoccus lapidicaptus TaxID=1427523 RepID=UPI00333E9E65